MSTQALSRLKKGGGGMGSTWQHLAPKRGLGVARDLGGSQGAGVEAESLGGMPQLHHDYAGLAVMGLEGAPRIQAKLRIGPAGDKYEQEADRVADQVMRMPEPAVQRKCTKCKEEEGESLRMAPVSSLGALASSRRTPANDQELEHRVGGLRQGGVSLDPETRDFMERRLGQDLSSVRIHLDGEAGQMARKLGARAFTIGQDVFFGDGEYRPRASDGRRLIAHELVHTQQQSLTVAPSLQLARLLDFKDRVTFPSDDEIEATNEYKAFMNHELVWYRDPSLRMSEAQARHACRLILQSLQLGKTVNWTMQALGFVKREVTGGPPVNRSFGSKLISSTAPVWQVLLPPPLGLLATEIAQLSTKHGYWCGELSDCAARNAHCNEWFDGMDWCCMMHDKHYDRVGVSSKPGKGKPGKEEGNVHMDSWKGRALTRPIDIAFIECVKRAKTNNERYRRLAIKYFEWRTSIWSARLKRLLKDTTPELSGYTTHTGIRG